MARWRFSKVFIYLIFLSNSNQMCIIQNELLLYLPGELTFNNNLEVISIDIVVLRRFCGMFPYCPERDHFVFMCKLCNTGMSLLKFPGLLKWKFLSSALFVFCGNLLQLHCLHIITSVWRPKYFMKQHFWAKFLTIKTASGAWAYKETKTADFWGVL